MIEFPTRESVLAFIEANPDANAQKDIARGLGLKGPARTELRRILKLLEEEGVLSRTGRRRVTLGEKPPPTGVVVIERMDDAGALFGRVDGREGRYGPELVVLPKAGRRTDKVRYEVGDRALSRIDKTAHGWTAHPIKKVGSAREDRIVGVFHANDYGGRVAPASKKETADLIVERHDVGEATDGDLVACELRARRGYGPKRARIVAVFGKADAPDAASLLALHQHGIPDVFPDAVIAEATDVEPMQAPREDLRDTPLLTIDPPDARDHDDAVFAEADGDGWRVIVAIADVAAYVRPGSALDREAFRRGNSTYFPDRVVPMLPEELSADACSLRAGEDRLCFAVEMRFDAGGRKTSHRFLRAVMRSAAKLSYRQAQDAIDGAPDETTAPLLEPVLKPLWAAWKAVDKARLVRNPLELDLPERRIELSEDGRVLGVSLRERFDAHRLIEEFMIQANVCAAESLEAKRQPPLYRVHEPPSEEKLHGLSLFLPTVGLKWTRGETPSSARFNRLLAAVKGEGNEGLVMETVLRTQSQARYSPESLGHFGLNLRRYSHFTSPIRRYADLVTHRALIDALRLGPDGAAPGFGALEEIGEQITMTERRSMAAERDASDRYLAAFLSDRIGAEFEGRITGVRHFGLFVRLKETGADGFVPVSTLGGGFWRFDEAAAKLVDQDSGDTFRLGMDVTTRLLEAVPVSGGLRLEMASDPEKGERPRGRGHPSARMRAKAPPSNPAAKRHGHAPGPRKDFKPGPKRGKPKR